MKLKFITMLVVSTFFIITTVSKGEFFGQGDYFSNVLHWGTPLSFWESKGFPISGAISNYIETSGLFLSPESTYKLGNEWDLCADSMLLKLSTNIMDLAQNSITNKINSVELQKIFEFLVSPRSYPKSNTIRLSKIAETKYKILIAGFYMLADGKNTNFTESAVKTLKMNPWEKDEYYKTMKGDTNSVIGIANALAFVKSRRYTGFNTNLVVTINHENPTNNIVKIYWTHEMSNNKKNEPVVSYIVNYKIKSLENREIELASGIEAMALAPMINEERAAEKYLYDILKESFMFLTRNTDCIITNELFNTTKNIELVNFSNLITQVSEIADLREKETRELREITERMQQLYKAAKSSENDDTNKK